MTLYYSSLKTVKNTRINKTRYYIKKCNVWSRVSKKDYNHRDSIAERTDNFLTYIKGDLIHQYKTIYFKVKL